MEEPNKFTEAQQRFKNSLHEVELEPKKDPKQIDNNFEFDQMIERLWGKDGVVTKNKEQEKFFEQRINEAKELSTKQVTIAYKTKKEKMIKGFLGKATIFLLTVATTVSLGVEAKQDIENFQSKQEVISEITASAYDNKHYGSYNEERKELNWWVESRDMAMDVLNKNPEYDLDTKIYGCYTGLTEYKKMDYMDKLFYFMNDIVYSTPEKYSQDVLDICKNTTFNDYLIDKGLTLDEWKHQMQKITDAYAKLELKNDELEKIINDLEDLINEQKVGGR